MYRRSALLRALNQHTGENSGHSDTTNAAAKGEKARKEPLEMSRGGRRPTRRNPVAPGDDEGDDIDKQLQQLGWPVDEEMTLQEKQQMLRALQASKKDENVRQLHEAQRAFELSALRDGNELHNLGVGDQLVHSPASFAASLGENVTDDFLMSPAETGKTSKKRESSAEDSAVHVNAPSRRRLGLSRTVHVKNASVKPSHTQSRPETVSVKKRQPLLLSDSTLSELEIDEAMKSPPKGKAPKLTKKTCDIIADESIVISDESDSTHETSSNTVEQKKKQSKHINERQPREGNSEEVGSSSEVAETDDIENVEQEKLSAIRKAAARNRHQRNDNKETGSEGDIEEPLPPARQMPASRNEVSASDEEIVVTSHATMSRKPPTQKLNVKRSKRNVKMPTKTISDKMMHMNKSKDQTSLHHFGFSEIASSDEGNTSHLNRTGHPDSIDDSLVEKENENESKTDQMFVREHQESNESDIFEMQDPDDPAITSVTLTIPQTRLKPTMREHLEATGSSSDEAQTRGNTSRARRRHKVISSSSPSKPPEDFSYIDPLPEPDASDVNDMRSQDLFTDDDSGEAEAAAVCQAVVDSDAETQDPNADEDVQINELQVMDHCTQVSMDSTQDTDERNSGAEQNLTASDCRRSRYSEDKESTNDNKNKALAARTGINDETLSLSQQSNQGEENETRKSHSEPVRLRLTDDTDNRRTDQTESSGRVAECERSSVFVEYDVDDPLLKKPRMKY